jgi:hypothetical protein
MGELAGGVEYPAVNAAITRFERRLKIDPDLQKKLKKIAKTLKNCRNIHGLGQSA